MMYKAVFDSPTVIKQGDTKQKFIAHIINSVGSPVNLSGSSVEFIMSNKKGVVLKKSVMVTDASSGKVEFSFNSSDVTGFGKMDAEFKVSFSSPISNFKVPTVGYISFTINQELLDRGNEIIAPSLYSQLINQVHTHNNKGVLDRLGISKNNNLTIDGAEKLGGGASKLSDLTDVSKTTPTEGQVLKYLSGSWKPGSDSTGSGGGSNAWGDITGKPSIVNTVNGQSGNVTITSGTGTLAFPSVIDFGAVGDGVTDDTQAFKDALTANRQAYVPYTDAGYLISSEIVIPWNGVKLLGHGRKQAKLISAITDPNMDLFRITCDHTVTFDNIQLIGTGQERHGVYFDNDTTHTTLKHVFTDVIVEGFGMDGIHAERPEQYNFTRVFCDNNGRHGFYFHGQGQVLGIACKFDTCRAVANGGNGFNIEDQVRYTMIMPASFNNVGDQIVIKRGKGIQIINPDCEYHPVEKFTNGIWMSGSLHKVSGGSYYSLNRPIFVSYADRIILEHIKASQNQNPNVMVDNSSKCTFINCEVDYSDPSNTEIANINSFTV